EFREYYRLTPTRSEPGSPRVTLRGSRLCADTTPGPTGPRARRRTGFSAATPRRSRSSRRAGYEEARPAIELGTRVRQLRLDARLWTQEELARRARMTQPALSRLERGGGIPTITVLDRIASALHATLTV